MATQKALLKQRAETLKKITEANRKLKEELQREKTARVEAERAERVRNP